ncbi:MAG: electron transfer flavoprotein subunit alpha/FixB family protein [Sulfolobales archaeon]
MRGIGEILVIGSLGDIRDLTGVAGFISSNLGDVGVDALLISYTDLRFVSELESFGLENVYYIEERSLETPEEISSALIQMIKSHDYRYIIGVSSKILKEAFAIASQKLERVLMVDIASIERDEEGLVAVRSVMAGRVRSRERVPEKAFIIVGVGRSKPAKISDRKTVIKPLKIDLERKLNILERKPKAAATVRLEEAEIIVSVGRGFRSKEDLKIAFELAEALGGQVGCSRPIAADLKWLPEEHWVGLSGKKVKPKLYIALGISGQPQHIAGILDSRIIVAVNKDPNAPIFKNSDYGIVGDLYEFIPLFKDMIKSLKAG